MPNNQEQIDVNKPLENPALMTAINSMLANFNTDTENSFITELKKAHFLSPVSMSSSPPTREDSKTTLEKGTTISFISLTNSAGAKILPVFTDWTELKKWRDMPNEQTFIISYDDACTVTSDHHLDAFAINPYGCNLIITLEMIKKFNNSATS